MRGSVLGKVFVYFGFKGTATSKVIGARNVMMAK